MSQCDDIKCDSSEHRNQIDQWYAQLVDCCLLAGDVLPHVRNRKETSQTGMRMSSLTKMTVFGGTTYG